MQNGDKKLAIPNCKLLLCEDPFGSYDSDYPLPHVYSTRLGGWCRVHRPNLIEEQDQMENMIPFYLGYYVTKPVKIMWALPSSPLQYHFKV
jgi:hypothetical protein